MLRLTFSVACPGFEAWQRLIDRGVQLCGLWWLSYVALILDLALTVQLMFYV